MEASKEKTGKRSPRGRDCDNILGTLGGSGLKYRGEVYADVRYVDSHLHLSDYPDPASVLRWANSSETLLLANGVDGKSSVKSLDMARGAPAAVFAFVGTHPSEAEKEGDVGWLEGAAARAAGIGEIGLDPKYSSTASGSRQRELFELQLGVAEKTRKPVQVHTRDAEKECLDLLSSYRVERVLLHWFEGEELLKAAASRGHYVSFGPAILYSKKLGRMAQSYPRELILTESDGPVPFKALGGVAGPMLVPSVLFALAGMLHLSTGGVADLVRGNCTRYLGGRSKG